MTEKNTSSRRKKTKQDISGYEGYRLEGASSQNGVSVEYPWRRRSTYMEHITGKASVENIVGTGKINGKRGRRMLRDKTVDGGGGTIA